MTGVPLIRPPEWTKDALCAEVGGDDWFPEKGGPTRAAKSICKRCEVQSECLGWALEHGERFGIWGGLSEGERRVLARRLRESRARNRGAA